MAPKKKRIRSDDSENSTVDSKGRSSGSDIQITRDWNKKISSEDYDGDCELENPGKNRITRKATRSRILKQKPANSLENDSSSSTPAAGMEVDLHGFESLTTPLPLSPISSSFISTCTPSALTPEVCTEHEIEPSVAMAMSKPLFQTPVEKPAKKYKRKRVPKCRQAQNHSKLVTESEASMIAHFNEIEDHELLIE